jgi:hypothetical protein
LDFCSRRSFAPSYFDTFLVLSCKGFTEPPSRFNTFCPTVLYIVWLKNLRRHESPAQYYEKPDNLGIPIKSRSEDDQKSIRGRSKRSTTTMTLKTGWAFRRLPRFNAQRRPVHFKRRSWPVFPLSVFPCARVPVFPLFPCARVLVFPCARVPCSRVPV